MTYDRRSLLIAATGAAMTAPAWVRAEAAEPTADPIPGILAATGQPALTWVGVGTKGVEASGFGGVRRIGAADKVAQDDLWHLGSNGKAMTAALYGRLVEAGRAKWGATVPELFPDLTIDPAWAKTTVEQLLGHRAGVEEESFMESGWLLAAHADRRPIREQRMDLARTILAKPPAGTPGAYAYANFNYVIVGAAMERILNQSWEDGIVTRLFKPLGIKSAGFGAPLGAQPWGHYLDEPVALGKPAKLTPVDPAGLADNPPALGPAGRIHMSMSDYARFARLFLARGDGVLKPETVERLVTPVPGAGQAYALGWIVIDKAPWAGGGPVLTHDGSNGMWHASTLVAPARGQALLVASNGPVETTAVLRLMQTLRRQRLPAAG
ncbi:serine hydrolase domain-containing protein [Caulobacter mirabilis]|uniref:Serine hydrolase n=1 Tax=Caulobacter mirabilis TaxID=69666 RepID=A0A2D2ATL4_9CAUL|nr:serine hydrolase domain-containing protein [Caulobacter mirabilis]ATQ41305.1 serine hydrolase [Caulobacter mirabilis]